jgi:hypothetical protein
MGETRHIRRCDGIDALNLPVNGFGFAKQCYQFTDYLGIRCKPLGRFIDLGRNLAGVGAPAFGVFITNRCCNRGYAAFNRWRISSAARSNASAATTSVQLRSSASAWCRSVASYGLDIELDESGYPGPSSPRCPVSLKKNWLMLTLTFLRNGVLRFGNWVISSLR